MQKTKKRQDVFGTSQKRVGILFLSILLIFAYLLSTILRMQFCSYDTYQNKVFEQITTSSKLRAKRGQILDASGNVLAESITVWRVFVSPVDIKEAKKNTGIDYADTIASLLSPVLSMEYTTIYQKASNSSVIDETLKKNVDEETYERVVEIVQAHDLGDMVHTEAYDTRYYPGGDFLCHVLGFTGTDGQGLFGLEYQYDSLLTGTDGYYLYAKDANGNEMPNQYAGFIEAKNGASLITTIDSYLQQQLEYQLDDILATYEVQNRVTGVVMNVKTGAILAMATTNGFDCNSPYQLDSLYMNKLENAGLSEGSAEYKALKNELLYTMWSNKAISELYEPGSTFKIFTASVGVETGATTMEERYSCTGSLKIGGYNISCHKRGGHGSQFTFAFGLQNSCNPTMMTVAAEIGAERFYEYFKKFGYLEKTGIDLPSEATTIFHKPEQLGTTELATASFGQRFKVTILNQITAIACVANGGYLVTPYLVDSIVNADGSVAYVHTPAIKRQVISASTASQIADCLEKGVSGDGGAKNAYVAGYQVAAKTGTSQKFDILDENGNSYLRVGSCVAFAPSDNAEIAVIIVVDEPQHEKYGSIVAAPYISSFLEKALPYLECKGIYDEKCATYTTEDLVGQKTEMATAHLKEQGISYTVIGKGDTILSQVPSQGSVFQKNLGTVLLYTIDEETAVTSIPNVLGMDAQSATQAMLDAGLNIAIAGAKNYYIGKEVYVTAQSGQPGLIVQKGTVILLTFRHNDSPD